MTSRHFLVCQLEVFIWREVEDKFWFLADLALAPVA